LKALAREVLKSFSTPSDSSFEAPGMPIVRRLKQRLLERSIYPEDIDPLVFIEGILDLKEDETLWDLDTLVLHFEDAWDRAWLPENANPVYEAFRQVQLDAFRVPLSSSFRTEMNDEEAALTATVGHFLCHRQGYCFLPCRDVAAAVGHGDRNRANVIIRKLINDGTFIITQEGTTTRSPRLIYVEPEQRQSLRPGSRFPRPRL